MLFVYQIPCLLQKKERKRGKSVTSVREKNKCFDLFIKNKKSKNLLRPSIYKSGEFMRFLFTKTNGIYILVVGN